MNAVLELDAVLDVILHSAQELLVGRAARSCSWTVTRSSRCVRNNPDALGRRVAIGEGIAGRVARTKEPLLINGQPTSKEFPGAPSACSPSRVRWRSRTPACSNAPTSSSSSSSTG
jgi:hypothetical protein